MCGIAGVWSRSTSPQRARLQPMLDSLTHRGPDSGGTWCEGPVYFGHRRLAILDLSPSGHQPMESANRRFVMSFNGEVFNFLELRRELESLGHRFVGGSDTEVMLAAFSHWGLEDAVGRFVGMFAFSVWDRETRSLHLVRDRIGIKPLYVGRTGAGDLLFASEMRAFAAHPEFNRRMNRAAVSAFLRYGYVPAPLTAYEGAVKLRPGHILTLKSPADDISASAPYWDLASVAAAGSENPFAGNMREAEEQLNDLLRYAVHLRMIADVPLGAFLSGGIDSSLVVALMQAQSSRSIRTFTIGFADHQFNEATHARAVAAHLGTNHTDLVVTERDLLDVVPRLAGIHDEPFADSSQIPTFLVSALARRDVTVSLSGDGGDELFGGYSKYARTDLVWRATGWIPASARAPMRRLFRGLARVAVLDASRAEKIGEWLAAADAESMFERINSVRSAIDTLMKAPIVQDQVFRREALMLAKYPLQSRFMFADTRIYLPDDLLTKLDRASMAVSLESRVPLLDHRVVEFAWRLPAHMRQGKRLLRRLLGRYVPRTLFDRPKMGFQVPLASWLRGPLKNWASDALMSPDFGGDGLFDVAAVRRTWSDVLAGRGDIGLAWKLVIFDTWRRQWDASF